MCSTRAASTILRGVQLPAWLGWISIAIGIVFVIPPIEFAGFLLFLVWVAVVSILLMREARAGHSDAAHASSSAPNS
jgi:hypothetical protein